MLPVQVARLLEVAAEETLPYWAIGAFAGLRVAKKGDETIKLATFTAPSYLIRQGSLQNLDARQRVIQNEIEAFRERFFHLEARCKGLVANFRILESLLKNEDLKKRLRL